MEDAHAEYGVMSSHGRTCSDFRGRQIFEDRAAAIDFARRMNSHGGGTTYSVVTRTVTDWEKDETVEPWSQEKKIAFRKEWDRRVEEGAK